jgi:hypothetical protein
MQRSEKCTESFGMRKQQRMVESSHQNGATRLGREVYDSRKLATAQMLRNCSRSFQQLLTIV